MPACSFILFPCDSRVFSDSLSRASAALEASWPGGGVEARAEGYARAVIVPRHVEEVRARRLPEIDKVEREVVARLKKEINHWDRRAQELKAQERAGRRGRLSAGQAQARANDLDGRLRRRRAALELERDIRGMAPQVRGGAVVVPGGLLRGAAEAGCLRETTAEGRAAVERLAMEAVAAAERALGHVPRDVSGERLGYDIESREKGSGRLRFIEVKGRARGAETVSVTRNEIVTALHARDAYILAVVEVADGFAGEPRYVRAPFVREPDFGATSVTYRLADLLARAEGVA